MFIDTKFIEIRNPKSAFLEFTAFIPDLFTPSVTLSNIATVPV